MDTFVSLIGPLSLAFIGWVIAIPVLSAFQSRDAKRWFALFTGAAIYFPYCVVQVPEDAIVIGVGMHWSQYLAINYAVYGRRFSSGAVASVIPMRGLAAAAICLYAVVMATIGTSPGTSLRPASVWFIIPLCGQFLHYYLDAFIWPFSDPHIRNNVGAYLWAR
jgi:hypothetical protein